MQNGQTEPKLYVDTTQALFVHSKKNKKRKPFMGFQHQIFNNPSVTS